MKERDGGTYPRHVPVYSSSRRDFGGTTSPTPFRGVSICLDGFSGRGPLRTVCPPTPRRRTRSGSTPEPVTLSLVGKGDRRDLRDVSGILSSRR